LLAGSAAIATALLGGNIVRAAEEAKTAVLCFTDIGADTPPELVSRIVNAFISRNLPVSCAVTFGASTGGPLSPLMLTLRELGAREPGLFEICATLPELEYGARYFQMRDAEQLRRSIVENLFPAALRAAQFPVVSVFAPRGQDELDFSAFRSAGFRSILRPTIEPGTTQLTPVGRGQLDISGGISLDLAQNAVPSAAEIEAQLSTSGPLLVTISLALTGGVDPELLIERCSELAHNIDVKTSEGRLFATRPTDLLLHAIDDPAPMFAVLLRPPETDAEDDPMRIFARGLAENGILFTTMVGQGGFTGPDTAAFCTVLPEEHGLPDPRAGQIYDSSFLPENAPLADAYPSPYIIRPQNIGDTWSGLKQDGRYHIAALGAPDMPLAELLPTVSNSDNVIIIYPENVATFLQRARLINRLMNKVNTGLLKLETVDGFAKHMMAGDPVLGRFQSTRKRTFSDPAQQKVPSPAERESYLSDARLAWLYIDKYTDENTGLCAGTVRGGPSTIVHHQATLWDIASQLQGIVAAHKLAIIDTIEAQQRAGKILENLPVSRVEDLRLPPAFFSTKTSASTRDGFDFCDTGRFFTALSSAQDAGLVTVERGQEVFAGWDIAAAARDGHPFDYKRGRWVDSFPSHCTPYARRGMAPWGLNLSTPYANMDGENAAADRMRLLYSVAKIGHYGTEPFLLEAIELGETKESRYLADVLFDAQLSYFERTGQLKAASETLLDFEPWFSYQGIRVDEPEEDGWVIAAADPDAQFNTERFKLKSEVISSKSSYLWAANYAHAYSDKLVDFTREKARVEGLGFAAGVYTQSGEVMANYCDINTNGIILTAIAQIAWLPPLSGG